MDYIIPQGRVSAAASYGHFDRCEEPTLIQAVDVTAIQAAIGSSFKIVPSFPRAALMPNWLRSHGLPDFTSSHERDPHGRPSSVCFATEAVPVQPDVVSYSELVKTRQPFKQFEAARKSGLILLKPLRHIEAHATPDWLPSQGDVLLDVNQVRVGFLDFETPTRPCAPAYYAWRYESSSGAVPFQPIMPISGIFTLPMLQHGRLFGGLSLGTYRGKGPSPSFTKATGPQLAKLVKYFDQQQAPVNLKTSALDENFSGIMDVLTEIGEAPETIRYIYDLLRRIIMIFVGMRSKEAALRKKFKGKELVDEIASLWMQFRYAISPLAFSVNDALDLLNRKPVQYISTRKREDVAFRYEDGRGFEYKGVIEHRVFVKSRVTMTSFSGMGLNPAKTLWELTPLSFVIDWVLPIGQLLGAILPPSDAQQIAVLESKRVRSVTMTGGKLAMDYYVCTPTNRVPNGIGFDPNLNFKRLLDSLALAWSLFLKQHWKS